MKQIDISKIKEKLKTILGKYKNYKSFSMDKKRAYEYAELFDIKVCPYCNINYIYTVINSKQFIIRPDFDHFSAISHNKNTQLLVENLIPSCSVCNSRLKGSKVYTSQSHLHPFEKDFDSIVEFDIDIKNPNYLQKKAFDIILKRRKNASLKDYNLAKNNISDFKLNERYNNHTDTVIEILDELKYYHEARLNEIENLINPHKKLQSIFIMDRVLGYKTIDINKTSLGKLKKDITEKYS